MPVDLLRSSHLPVSLCIDQYQSMSHLTRSSTRPSLSLSVEVIASDIVRSLLRSLSDALGKVRSPIVVLAPMSHNSVSQSITAAKEGSGSAVLTDNDIVSHNTVYYYLFLGRLSKTLLGSQALADNDIFVQ